MVFICDQRLGTFVEHRRAQRRQLSLGCDTTPRLGETQTRGLQFLLCAELERATCGAVCDGARSDNPADIKGFNAELMTKHVSAVGGRYSAGRPSSCPEVVRMWDSLGHWVRLNSECCTVQPT